MPYLHLRRPRVDERDVRSSVCPEHKRAGCGRPAIPVVARPLNDETEVVLLRKTNRRLEVLLRLSYHGIRRKKGRYVPDAELAGVEVSVA